MLTSINHWCSSKDWWISLFPVLIISVSSHHFLFPAVMRGALLPCQSKTISRHLPNVVNNSSTLAQHLGYSHHCHAFTLSPLHLLWRNLPECGISSYWGSQITSWNFKKWSLKSKHNLHYKCVALASFTCSSHVPLMWPQRPSVLSFGRDLGDLARVRLTNSQAGLLFPRSEDL